MNAAEPSRGELMTDAVNTQGADAVRPVRCYSCGHQFGAVPDRIDTQCPECGSDSFTRTTGDGCTCGAPASTPSGMHHDHCSAYPGPDDGEGCRVCKIPPRATS